MQTTNTTWLTGSGGFIGAYLAPALRKISRQVVGLRHAPEMAGATAPDGCRLLDLGNPAHLQECVRQLGIPDVFIHLGWGAMADPASEEHLTGNLHCAKTLIDTLYEAGLKRFVFIGSTNEYGARTGMLTENLAPIGRMTNYGKAKYAVTQYGLARAKSLKREFICARPFYVFGAGQRSGSLLNKLYRCYREGQKAELGPCEHFRDYVHVSEVAEGITRLAQVAAITIANIGSGRVIRVRDYVLLFWKLLGGRREQLQFGANPMRAGEPEQPWAYAGLEHLKELTGWTPILTLEQGLQLTIEGLTTRPDCGLANIRSG